MKQPYQDNAALLMKKTYRPIKQKRLSRNSSHKYGQLISNKVAKGNSIGNSKEMYLNLTLHTLY